MGDDTARPYHCAIANGDSGADSYVAPKPTVLSNLYGESRLNRLATLEIVDGMLGSVERAVGTNERVCSVRTIFHSSKYFDDYSKINASAGIACLQEGSVTRNP